MRYDLDDPQTTAERAHIIKAKPYLHNLYYEHYYWFKRRLTPTNGKTIVELGSGGGFIKEVIPNAITSDILNLPAIDKQFSALLMPFKKNTVDAFVMINVFHHIKNAKRFFLEADRCLKSNGKILMIEPANTLWSRFIYQYFHHEPFDTRADWKFKKGGALSGANGALPWILFIRDRKRFEKEFPRLHIVNIRPHTPVRYLISGGFTYRQLLPSWTYRLVRRIESLLSPISKFIGMFYSIEISKT